MEDAPVQTADTTLNSSTPAPITTTYTNGTNVVSFTATYQLLKKLLAHPECSHRNIAESRWPCPVCETSFTNRFWDATATLLDYFADFFPKDDANMQSLWFHLLDMWQSAALWLGHTDTLYEAFHTPQSRRCAHDIVHAEQFKRDFELTRKLFETIIYGPKMMARGSVKLSEDVIHPPDGVKPGPSPGQHETGPWISGLKPWQQWLCAGSPGVAAPPSVIPVDEDKGETLRHVPMSAVAIIHQHTQRARGWALHLASREPETVRDKMAVFDAHSLRFPKTGKTAAYTSVQGRAVRYRLVNGAPPVGRVPGLLDWDMRNNDPDLAAVDECVGLCRGEEAYVAQSGFPEEEEEEEEGDGGEEVEDDGEDDGEDDEEQEEEQEEEEEDGYEGEEEGEEEEDEDEADSDEDMEEEIVEDELHGWFDMWSVVESKKSKQDKGQFAGELDNVFDEWAMSERAQRIDGNVRLPARHG
ncbi:hypothetical protein IAQ61_008476 [Plenodomus lingam]|uniref:uncharacterized protein n=1 Tax=Leptosphaeria maculans TaxID=5022 RepID=UPI0033305FAF|nr:hypothetical protein IAQ61_008476 [Plenodomus lingam]